MKVGSRRVAAVVLAAALSTPLFAAQQREDRTIGGGFARVVREIKRFVGRITLNEGFPTPPLPTVPARNNDPEPPQP